MDWSFDMAKAPRGSYDVIPAGPKASGARKVFRPDTVILASACGVVTVSHYLPEERRWNMFTRDVGPIAWMPITGMLTETVGGKPKQVLPAHPTLAEGRQSSARHQRRAAEAQARKEGQGLSIPAIKKRIRRNKQRQK